MLQTSIILTEVSLLQLLDAESYSQSLLPWQMLDYWAANIKKNQDKIKC